MRTLITCVCTALLAASLPTLAGAQARPQGVEPIVVPDTYTPPPAAPRTVAPAPAVPRGGFKKIPIQPPTIAELFRSKEVAVDGQDRAATGADTWAYAVYEPGGAFPKPNRAAVLLIPEGSNPVSAVEGLDLRTAARTGGWRLIVLPAPTPAPRPTSGTAAELAQAQRDRDGDSGRFDRLLAAVLSQEGAFGPPAIVATSGTGDSLLTLLCGRTGRAPSPSHAVVMGGAIDTRQAAACRPNRVPALLIARSTDDQSTPYGGGAQPALPGNGPGADVLSAATTRGLWAALARCSDGQPSVVWMPSQKGRLALETHTRCNAGGPVSMLSAIEGASLPQNEELTVLVANFLGGKG
jgi:hypothetical protein